MSKVRKDKLDKLILFGEIGNKMFKNIFYSHFVSQSINQYICSILSMPGGGVAYLKEVDKSLV